MKYLEKNLMQGLSKYNKTNYYDFKRFFRIFFKKFQKNSKNISSKAFTNTVKKETVVPHVIPFSPLEYFKLANIAILQVLRSIENEQCFILWHHVSLKAL
jgi:hypothetical protein